MTSLYIHLPFCRKKCHYCDFVSYAGKEELIDEYVGALCQEINSPPLLPLSYQERGLGGELSTIFFGGGTPTLLEPRHFEQIMKILSPSPSGRGGWGVRVTEISIEANPGTADLAKLKVLRQLGINRLSIGVQSFNNQHLRTLGRIHTAEEAIKFYENACTAEFDNINLDLMFALPGQTLDEWKKDLDIAIDLKPNHLSTYNLELHPETPLYLQLTTNNLQPASEELDLAMYEHTIETLTAHGYKHYEISNFAKPGFECQHNINYWQNGNYLGLGAGAHSHWNGKRWANLESIEEYVNNDIRQTKDVSSIEADRRETIFMGLRLLDGLPVAQFAGFEREVDELIKDGLLRRRNGCYQLTRQGLYLANLVFAKFV